MLSVSGFPSIFGSDSLVNHGIATSVAASALTIALKDAAGNDPSSASPVRIAFRSTTLTTGTITMISATAALSTVISSGSTAGHVSGVSTPLFVYAINNAGTMELAWSTLLFDENQLVTTTAEGAGGAADSATTIYSTTARTSVACRVIGKLLSNQATAGTWAAVPTNSEIGSVGKLPAYVAPTVQRFASSSGTYTTPTSPRIPIYIQVEICGGGGGGGGSGTTIGTAAGAGGNSTFGSSLLTANGGALGTAGAAGGGGGAGGTTTVSAPAISIISVAGGYGGGGSGNNAASLVALSGGNGGSSAYGGAGSSGPAVAGTAGITNTGGGGGAGGTPNTASTTSGGGGGAGGYIKAILTNPSATYAYAVGAAGTAGVAGTSGTAGAAGGSGVVIVTEYYQ